MASSAKQAAESFTFERATRAQIPLLIGLAGGTGSGKTYTAMELASGMSGGKPFAVIDTENGRARHYANEFAFDRADLGPPFRPERYEAAILAADAAGYPVIVVDSMSHVWAGDGGILDWQEDELDRMAGQDWQKREACKMAAWIKPKMEHKHMVQRLLQVRAHVVLCFRAEAKIEIVTQDGKWKAVPKSSPVGLDGWLPICEKNLPFELTCSFLLTADQPGVPKPIKLQKQHRPFFALDAPIVRAAGEKLARWAAGDDLPTATGQPAPKTAAPDAKPAPAPEARALASLEAAYKVGRAELVAAFKLIESYYATRNQPIPLAVDAKYAELNEALKE